MKSLAFAIIGAQLLVGLSMMPAVAIAQTDTDTQTVVVTAEADVVAEPVLVSEPVTTEPVAVEQAIVTATEVADTAEQTPAPLEGVVVAEPTKAPGTFGLFWRNVRERVSLATTINPVKKAEKELQFAEERLKIAKLMTEKSTDPKVQAKAADMVKRATSLISNIEEKKEKLLSGATDEQKARLLRNIATHEQNRAAALERLEKKVSPERVAEMAAERLKALEQGKRLLNAINNENVPEDVRAKLQAIKTRTNERVMEVQKLNAERKELFDRVQSGDEGAKAEVKALQEKRQEVRKDFRADVRAEVKALREEVKEVREEKKANVPAGQLRVRTQSGEDDEIDEVNRPVPVEKVRQEIQQKINAIDVKKIDVNPAAALKEAQRLKTLSEQKKVDLEERVRKMEGEDQPAPQRAPGAVQRQF